MVKHITYGYKEKYRMILSNLILTRILTAKKRNKHFSVDLFISSVKFLENVCLYFILSLYK